MVQPMVTRSQRRIERKQVALIVVLILAVSGVSFCLGVLFGQNGGSIPGLSADIEKPKLPMVASVVPPPPPPVTEAVPEKLTFYDNLPKGNQAPLGSGINLPPEQDEAAAAVKKQSVAKPAAPPEIPKKPVAEKAVAADGPYLVQVASFRTSEDAVKMANRLKVYKLTSFVESADLGKKGVWFRVLVGPYASREKADQAAGLLRDKERLSAMVRQR